MTSGDVPNTRKGRHNVALEARLSACKGHAMSITGPFKGRCRPLEGLPRPDSVSFWFRLGHPQRPVPLTGAGTTSP
jgi:hypothetical protein